ncbi:Na+/H+ antiporter subunit A [Paractinoplanes atraurantiacus]|uniref:Multicomponent Na+:H+ antiporter subunit A n=1 Tax=Paractinoplanes atraurantiacus TaxID=1036182 RepID=A0A285K8L9_9ACTN|nr:Na+/H+ antiporter subunit A [Actinoplanes atraurantiacus]SNY68952.1 multicomponent Na+:H+ antiporter subunit A [Actinoplanes atraurantiacus]
MLAILLLHALAALTAPVLIRFVGNRGLYALALVPASAAVWAVLNPGPVAATYRWVPHLDMDIALRSGPLPWLMLLIVGGVGAVVLAYCASYFPPGDPGLGRFAAVFLGFAGAMTGLVLSDDLLLLYVFWELTTVFSYLLIGHKPDQAAGRRAAMQALVVTTAGGLAMLAGFVILGHGAGTYRWSEIAEGPLPAGSTTAAVLILAGALSKSAIFPFSFWLPAAMAAPTPASAYLHAASMVKAGVFLVGLLGPVLAVTPAWQPIAVIGGAVTLLLGGWAALRQNDLKLLLAYGTVSQLGLLTVAFGAASKAAALAGVALLVAHALFKATLFLVVGIIDKLTGTRDLRELSGLARRMPVLAGVAALAVASMAGLPPLAGFVGKEALFAAFEHDPLVLAVLVAGSVLTVAYGLRFLWGAFGDKSVAAIDAARPSPAFIAPAALLAIAGLAVGVAAPALDRVLTPYVNLWSGTTDHLALWHGFGLPVLLSVVVLLGGTAIFLAQRRGLRWPEQRLPAADGVYRRLMAAIDRAAVEVTGATQRGSLPFSLGVILLVLVVMGATTLLLSGFRPDGVRLWDSPLQLVAGAVVVAAALIAVRAQRRLTAMILVGVCGYGVAVLFVLHGAPDLALTQFLVETVTIVMFVLVLRRLPRRFSERPRASRWIRMSVAVATGLVTSAMAYVAVSGRLAVPVSVDFPGPAVSFGGGHNVVNVALVDIRAWDTMGEISVLVVAATGVASLIYQRSAALQRRRAEQTVPPRQAGWLLAGESRESIILQVVARLLFHAIVLFSVYLLFSGHNAPGGGFAGGLVAGLALTIRYLAGGRRELNAAAPVDAGLVLGTGLLIAVGTGAAALIAGGQVLQSALVDVTLPLIGHVHFATSACFDVGVYLIVVGLVLEILRSLGGELDRQYAASETSYAAEDRREKELV